MTAREYLRQAHTARGRISTLREQIERLRVEMEGFGRATSDGSKVQSTPPKDPMGDLIARKLDKVERCEAELAWWGAVLMDVEDSIDAVQCDALWAYYILGQEIAEIADYMGLSVRRVREIIQEATEIITVPEKYL